MTALLHVTLDFCQECLGWDVSDHRRWRDKIKTPYIFIEQGVRLHYTNLTEVMEAARCWSGNHKVVTSLACGADGYAAEVERVADGQFETLAGVVHHDPCHAVLAACVEASRKMKGERR